MIVSLGRTIAARASFKPSRVVHTQYVTSVWAYRVWWSALLLLHLFNLAYYVTVAVLYKKLTWTNLDFQLSTYGIGIGQSDHARVSAVHAFVATLHAAYVIMMVASSIHARKLAFFPDLRHFLAPIARLFGRSANCYRQDKKTTDTQDQTSRYSSRSLSRLVSESVIQTGNAVFARDGLLGVDSVYFDHILLARELLETALQTYQAYRMTQLLPRPWLIRVYVLLLIANCWSVPVLHRIYKHRHTQRRMMSLLCDAVLDMVSSIGISIIIFATYAPQYTDPAFGFAFTKWFEDEWFTTMQQEFQMMLVVSWGDMASRLVFAFGLMQCMDAIKEMLTPVSEDHQSSRRRAATTDKQSRPNQNDLVVPFDRVGPTSEKPTPAPGSVQEAAPPISMKQRVVELVLHVLGPACFVIWGIIILVIHIVAESYTSDVACKLVLKPWLGTQPSCSLIELNCYDLQVSGVYDDSPVMRQAWEVFDPSIASRLVIRHCPDLVIPDVINRFDHMTALKLYNVSLSAWEDSNALTAAHHNAMKVIYMVRAELKDGVLPPGLTHAQFPRRMVSFVSSITNIQSLPPDLHTIWPPRMSLVFESSRLSTIPDTVVRLRPGMISFSGSPITSIQPEVFGILELEVVLAAFTRLQELPRNVPVVAPGMYLLFLDGTNVSTFWSWMEPIISLSLHFNNNFFAAFGTPYCQELHQIARGAQTAFSTTEPMSQLASVMDVSTPEKLQYALKAVSCKPGIPFYFPLPLEDIASAIAD